MQRSGLMAAALALLLIAGLWLLRPTSPDLAGDDAGADAEASTSSAATNRDGTLARRSGDSTANPVARARRAARSDAADSGAGDERFADRPAIAAAAQRARQHDLQRGPAGSSGSLDDVPEASGVAVTAVPKGDVERRAGSEISRAGTAAQERAHEQANEPADSATPGAKVDPTNGPVVSFDFTKTTSADQGDTAPILEHDITVTDAGARFGADAQFAIPQPENFTGQAGTVVFWLLPEWIGEAETNAGFAQWKTGTFENRIEIFKNGNYLRFLFCDNTGRESGGSISITGWKEGDWHHVGAVWGDGVNTLYIDGLPTPSTEYNGELEVPAGTPWRFGSDVPNGAGGARSTLRSFEIYPRALGPDEITAIVNRTRPIN